MVSPVLAQAILNQRAPDLVGNFRQGQQVGRQERARTLAGQALQGQQGALTELQGLDPQIALQIGEAIRANSAADIDETIKDMRFTGALLAGGDTTNAEAFLTDRLQRLQSQGRDTTQTQDVLNKVRTAPNEAFAGIQRFFSVLDSSKTGAAKVQSSEILPDGTTVQIMSDGSTRVTGPEGDEIQGAARTEAIRQAQEFGADIQGIRARERTEAGTEAKGREQRAQQAIDKGLAAADSTAVIRRSLDLLNDVETGGFDAVKLRAQQIFGVEGADEGELSANLGRNVLGQLRETFGAAFTEREGARLERLEAGFGKSPGTNRRLLQQALSIAERAARRGIRAAESRGDQESAEEIRQSLQFRVGDQQQTPEVQNGAQIEFLGFE